MLIPGYSHFGGTHPEVAALANVLIQLGVVTTHDGKPFSEALLIGIGGGLGGGYWVFEFGDNPPAVVLGARHDWQYGPGLFAAKVAERIGASATILETAGKVTAAKQLRERVDAGRPAIVACDLASMPYNLLPSGWIKHFYHTVVVVGLDNDDGTATVDDLAQTPLTVTQEQLAAARLAITSMKQRLVLIDSPPEPVDLADAITAGLRDCAEGLLNPPIRNFGLPAFAKWADLVANRKNKKGWPTVFSRDGQLFSGLISAYRQIELNGTGGGFMRPIYAAFLDEAGQITGRQGLGMLSECYRLIGDQWSALAAAALPDVVPEFAEVRCLLARRESIFAERGTDSDDERRAIDVREQEIETTAAAEFPLTATETNRLYDDLAQRISTIHAAEVAAARELEALAAG